MPDTYNLTISSMHINDLLEALRLHQVAVEAAPSPDRQKFICADLVRRADLLSAVIDAGDDLAAAQAAYDRYIREGDAPLHGGDE